MRTRWVNKKSQEWITELELLRGDLPKLNVSIDDSEMTTHILSNLPEEYKAIVEVLEDELYEKYHPLTFESICDKILVKFDQMNERSETKTQDKMKNPST